MIEMVVDGSLRLVGGCLLFWNLISLKFRLRKWDWESESEECFGYVWGIII